MSTHALAEYVRILARGKNASRSMTQEEAYFTMTELLAGRFLPEQLGAILMLMRVKEESAEELAGFAQAINNLWPDDMPVDLIWASYAGKRRQPFWCFLSALLVSQMGYRVLMHGTEAHTPNRMYMHQVFSAFQRPIIEHLHELSAPVALQYLPCSTLTPTLQQWLLLKSVLGVRSPINTVLKTIAPTGIPSVQGVFHPNYRQVHAQAAQLTHQRALIIKGEGGEFEVNPERRCEAWLQDGEVTQYVHITSQQSHFDNKVNDISNVHLYQLWRGDVSNPYAIESVLNTAALALCAIEADKTLEQTRQSVELAWRARDRDALSKPLNDGLS
ncbi:MAG: glycosyl transferase family protein [Bacterioplanes sp.]|nr:glycosyl transferase family protein [Bacterioplanes sp.]